MIVPFFGVYSSLSEIKGSLTLNIWDKGTKQSCVSNSFLTTMEIYGSEEEDMSGFGP